MSYLEHNTNDLYVGNPDLGSARFSFPQAAFDIHTYGEDRRKEIMSWTVSERVGYVCNLQSANGFLFKTDSSCVSLRS
jgi:hypothetical protein